MPNTQLMYGLGAALLVISQGPVQAETLMIDVVQASASVERPRNGQGMAAVQSHYGQPTEVMPAVGEPPITRWVYPGYTVYFEHDRVVHAVVHR